MSNISTAYDAIASAISTALPNHNELSNPYFPDADTDLKYDKAWGLAFSDGLNTELQISRRASIDRDFIVVITRKLRGLKNDLTTRKTTEKNLFEDQYEVIKALELDPDLQSSGAISKISYVNDLGLEFIRTERTDLLMIKSTMNMKYFEDLS